jgi:type VI protein secretion system component VasK
VNGRGRSFCQGFDSLLRGFPFQPSATAEVSMDDLAGALQPGTGLLWTFYADVLEGLLVPQGSRYVARPGATPTPTAAFVDFFNRAAAASQALFGEGRDGPEIPFVLGLQTSATIERVTVRIDGQTQEFTPTQAGNRPFVWQGNNARDANISGVVDGEARALVEVAPGPWALFRMFQLANWEPIAGGRYRLVWTLPGVPEPLTAELRLGGGIAVPIFQRSFLENLSCVSRIAR